MTDALARRVASSVEMHYRDRLPYAKELVLAEVLARVATSGLPFAPRLNLRSA